MTNNSVGAVRRYTPGKSIQLFYAVGQATDSDRGLELVTQTNLRNFFISWNTR